MEATKEVTFGKPCNQEKEAIKEVVDILDEDKNKPLYTREMNVAEDRIRLAIVGNVQSSTFGNDTYRNLTYYGTYEDLSFPGAVERKAQEWVQQNMLTGYLINKVSPTVPVANVDEKDINPSDYKLFQRTVSLQSPEL